MSGLSAYQDLMTALVTRRPGQSAAEDERIVLAALGKHAHELAEMQRGSARKAIKSGEIKSWHQVLDIIDLIDSEAPARDAS